MDGSRLRTKFEAYMSEKSQTMPFTTSSLCMELEYATLLELSTFRPFEVGRKGIAYLLFERF